MSDLISRQAAIDSLNDEFTIIGKTNAVIVKDYIRRVNNRLRSLPSAQPEIIRCKDCRFATLTFDGDCKYCQYLEGEFDLTDAVYFDGNDYCSHAERRTDE